MDQLEKDHDLFSDQVGKCEAKCKESEQQLRNIVSCIEEKTE